MSIEDSYARAITSRHLRTGAGAGDTDVLIAAGWTRGNAAQVLWRARAEYDAMPKGRSNCRATERLGVLIRMQSLGQARDAMWGIVQAHAKRTKTDFEQVRLLAISGRLLDTFLDPLCETCLGTRYKPVPNTGRLSATVCSECNGSGARRVIVDDGEAQFTRGVLDELDALLLRVSARMAKYLRERHNDSV